MIDVKGKWCLVTGGCRGVGRLIAIEMAKLGANLILQGRDKSHAEKVINELAPYGVQVKAVGCNLENEAEIDAALDEIDSFGDQVDFVSAIYRLGILANSAVIVCVSLSSSMIQN